MGKADILNGITKTSTYKKGKPMTSEQYRESIDNAFNKRFPIIENARKGEGGVQPSHKMNINTYGPISK
jgi:hypothetical protein